MSDTENIAPGVDEIQWGMQRMPALPAGGKADTSLANVRSVRMSDEDLKERIANVGGRVPGVRQGEPLR